MKKVFVLFVLLAAIFAVTVASCASIGSASTGGTSTDRAAMERAEKIAGQVQIGNYYLSQFIEFRDLKLRQTLNPEAREDETFAPGNGGGKGYRVLGDNRIGTLSTYPYPLINGGSGPRLISGGGSRWSPSFISVSNNSLSEENIDQAIAAYEAALKLEPSGTWVIPNSYREEALRYDMYPPEGGIQAVLENARNIKQQWLTVVKPVIDPALL